MSDLEVLKEFLTLPMESSDGVFDKFLLINDAIIRGERPERFAYLRGARKNKVLLVAHADTVWDDLDNPPPEKTNQVLQNDGIIYPKYAGKGLGADDRAGCALLWLLRESGHSLLLTDGEERGRLGAKFLMENNPDLAEEINRDHQFMVEFDRGRESDFKCYGVGTQEFRRYIEETLDCHEPERLSYTDIVTLCRDIPGVNLSLGYYKWHQPEEYLVIDEWLRAVDKYRSWLARQDLPKFALKLA